MNKKRTKSSGPGPGFRCGVFQGSWGWPPQCILGKENAGKGQSGQSYQRGGVLFSVLWIIVILSLLAFSLGQRARLELSLLKYSVCKAKSYYAARENLFRAVKEMETAPSELKREGGKINVNALTKDNARIFTALLEILGMDKELSGKLTASILDWQDEDRDSTDGEKETEDGYCKNAPLDSLEELLLVPGMSEEIFSRLKEWVTIYPKDRPGFLIDIFAAPEEVLRALARSASARAKTSLADADQLAAKIVLWRQKENRNAGDMNLLIKELDLSSSERVLFAAIQPWITFTSRFVRVRAEGKSACGFSTFLEAVIDRDSLSVVSWHRW